MEMTRRNFLSASVAAAVPTGRAQAIPPPGATVATLKQRCTACQACVSACRSSVLVAAAGEYGWSGLMMPRMVFAHGYCREDCTACGRVCPSGAIRPFTVEEKKKLAVGLAVFVRSDCLVEKEGLTCGNCVAHCPYTAIEMKAGDDKRKYPAVDAAKCVGCGACEYHCPVKAVRVQRRSPQTSVGLPASR